MSRIDNIRKVIYTCITNGYDTLTNQPVKIDGYDYVCFTDNPSIISDFWIVKEIPEELKWLDKAKQTKIIKICPHRYLLEYDMSIWFDGNLKLDFNFDLFIKSFIDDTYNIYFKKHPVRKCIYSEAVVCKRMKKDKPEIIDEQINEYQTDNFPSNFGLSENNFIVRFHNESDCKRLMEMWSDEVIKHSKRDQLSLMYCIWKTSTSFKYFNNDKRLNVTKHIKVFCY